MTPTGQPAPAAKPTAASRWGRGLLLGGALAAVVGAVLIPTVVTAAGGSERSDHPPTGTLSAWGTCAEQTDAATQCATLTVPVDWARPRGPKISLAATRRRADNNPGEAVGTLFFNPGGPGDTPNTYIAMADTIFSDTLRARFDIVGLDPRAVGATTKPRCDIAPVTAGGTLFPRTEEQFESLRGHNREFGQSCLDNTGALLAHTDTVSVARDHEALRAALGVDQVSWLGLSYGTQLAANYAELFPRRTRAMVLDAALEHSMPEIQQVADEAVAAEDSFNRFVAWCPTSPNCALGGQDVAAVFDRLVTTADRQPIAVDGALHAVTGEDIRMGTKGLLRFKEASIYGSDLSWAGLSRALAAALAGDASPFATPADAPQDTIAAVLAIGCMEYVPQIHNYDQMRQRIRLGRQLAPHLQGASETWQVNYCIDWPIPAANPPRTLHVTGVPTLIVHATHDPSVPLQVGPHARQPDRRGRHPYPRR